MELKKYRLLDSQAAQANIIKKSKLKYYLGGNGYGSYFCKVFTEGCHCGTFLMVIAFTNPVSNPECEVSAKSYFKNAECCVCGIDPIDL